MRLFRCNLPQWMGLCISRRGVIQAGKRASTVPCQMLYAWTCAPVGPNMPKDVFRKNAPSPAFSPKAEAAPRPLCYLAPLSILQQASSANRSLHELDLQMLGTQRNSTLVLSRMERRHRSTKLYIYLQITAGKCRSANRSFSPKGRPRSRPLQSSG